jgi:hypothetical protein
MPGGNSFQPSTTIKSARNTFTGRLPGNSTTNRSRDRRLAMIGNKRGLTGAASFDADKRIGCIGIPLGCNELYIAVFFPAAEKYCRAIASVRAHSLSISHATVRMLAGWSVAASSACVIFLPRHPCSPHREEFLVMSIAEEANRGDSSHGPALEKGPLESANRSGYCCINFFFLSPSLETKRKRPCRLMYSRLKTRSPFPHALPWHLPGWRRCSIAQSSIRPPPFLLLLIIYLKSRCSVSLIGGSWLFGYTAGITTFQLIRLASAFLYERANRQWLSPPAVGDAPTSFEPVISFVISWKNEEGAIARTVSKCFEWAGDRVSQRPLEFFLPVVNLLGLGRLHGHDNPVRWSGTLLYRKHAGS